MPHRTNVIDVLEAEWDDLAESRRLADALRAWAADDPALRFDSPAALVATTENRDRPGDADAVLAALARRAGTDDLAARFLLQLVLPGCKRLVRLYGRRDPEEWAALVVSTMWDRIRRYPIDRRPERVAANLLFDVRQRAVRAMRRHRPTASLHHLPEHDLPTVAPGPGGAAEVVSAVGEAVRRGRVDLDDARLVVLTRLGEVTVAEVARHARTGEQTVRRRRHRTEVRLRAVVAV